MPDFEITSPGGKTFTVTAPQGASQDQVLAYAKKQFARMEQAEADRKLYDPTKGMNVWEKSAANIGAGMDNLIHGVRQRYNELTGDKETAAALEAETLEKRKRDERLADSVTGGKILQIAGEAIPTLVIPGGGTIKGAAAIGALTGALQPTAEGESALMNAGIGGVMGGALSGAVKGAGKLYRAVRPPNAQARAAERIAEELGPDAAAQAAAMRQQLAQQVGAAPPPAVGRVRGLWQAMGNTRPGVGPAAAPGVGNVPLSAAARTQNEALARLEQADRLRNPQNWIGFDRAHGEGVANLVRRSTAEADDIATRVAQRGANYRTARAAAVDAMDADRFAAELPGFRQHLDDLLRSPDAVDSGVRSALNESRTMAGTEYVSPEHLMELRKNLSGRLVPGNILKSADRSNPAIQRLTGQIDNLLDNLSDDAWRPVNQGFRNDSVGVEAARAAQRARDVFFDPVTGGARKTAVDAAGNIPVITESGLQKALAEGWDKTRRADLFSAQTRQGLQEALDAVRAQGIIQRLNKTATAGGGSSTIPNVTAIAQEQGQQAILNRLGDLGPLGPLARGAAQTVGAIRNARTDQALMEAMQNPQAMQQLLAQVERTQGPQARASLARVLREMSRNAVTTTPGRTMDMRNQTIEE